MSPPCLLLNKPSDYITLLFLGEFFVAPRESSTLLVGVGPREEQKPAERYQSSFYRSTAQIATSPRNLSPVDVTVSGVDDAVDSNETERYTSSMTSSSSRSTSTLFTTTSSVRSGRNTSSYAKSGTRTETSDSKNVYSAPGGSIEIQLQGSERK